MQTRRFIQCDVFTPVPTLGNALAVVVDGDELSEQAMQQFAAWTNLAETTFILPPLDAQADYRLKIYTPVREMLFAGHPTLGSCAAWLQAEGRLPRAVTVAQGTSIGRHGRVAIEPLDRRNVKIGGQTHILIEGRVAL